MKIDIIKYNDKTQNDLIDKILSRSQLEHGDAQSTVDEILRDVKTNGDSALFALTKKFDNADINETNILVTKEEIEKAYKEVDKDLIEVIRKAKTRIEEYHSKQKLNSWFETKETGEILGQHITPIENVGVYVPGGKAVYPSSVLMNVLPAKIAGVKNIYMVTPPNADGEISPNTIVSAVEAGVDKIYKIGGAQSIGALAYGTSIVPKVDKIVGPGNIYVALAKKSVFGYVGIDSVAGPSEILVIADETANPKFVAADMLSQAEHDELACAILITNSKKLAVNVEIELTKQALLLSRKDIIDKSLENYGAIILVDDLDDAFLLSNKIAPEHLEVCTANPFSDLSKIKNAGAIFLGNYTPEPLGDYMAGPNHVIPTGGTSRFFSPLSVDDFIKKSSILSFNKNSIERIGEDVVLFAKSEQLTAHANSIQVRLDEK